MMPPEDHLAEINDCHDLVTEISFKIFGSGSW